MRPILEGKLNSLRSTCLDLHTSYSSLKIHS
jgi:hypothetical protein